MGDREPFVRLYAAGRYTVLRSDRVGGKADSARDWVVRTGVSVLYFVLQSVVCAGPAA